MTTDESKPADTNFILLKNVGPFKDTGLKIYFGEKQHENKANIHIFVGENGSGKSTVLKSLFFWLYGSKILISQNNDNYFAEFEKMPVQIAASNYDITRRFISYGKEDGKEIGSYPWVWYYTPNEPMIKKDEHIFWSKNRDSGNNKIESWICNYPTEDYLQRIQEIASKRDAILANDKKLESDRLSERSIEIMKNDIRLTELLEKFINNIYEIDFSYKFDVENDKYRPYFNGRYFEFNELSLGYRQIICLFNDLLIRVWDAGKSWIDDTAKIEREKLPFVLLLDEIDIHLHPKAQRKILPALQEMFPNAEIFCTTHSPFVVNSVDDAWIYELHEENYISGDDVKILNPKKSSRFLSNEVVLGEDFNVQEEYGPGVKEDLNELFKQINSSSADIDKIKSILNQVDNAKNTYLAGKIRFELNRKNIHI